jgi:hypothetical protein
MREGWWGRSADGPRARSADGPRQGRQFGPSRWPHAVNEGAPPPHRRAVAEGVADEPPRDGGSRLGARRTRRHELWRRQPARVDDRGGRTGVTRSCSFPVVRRRPLPPPRATDRPAAPLRTCGAAPHLPRKTRAPSRMRRSRPGPRSASARRPAARRRPPCRERPRARARRPATAVGRRVAPRARAWARAGFIQRGPLRCAGRGRGVGGGAAQPALAGQAPGKHPAGTRQAPRRSGATRAQLRPQQSARARALMEGARPPQV